jgi:hypothetical protein
MGRRDGGWVCSKLQMAQELVDHRALRDDDDVPQCPALTPWTCGSLEAKAAPQQPRPRPRRGSRGRFLSVHSLLARGGTDRLT